jgi:hypothetical protein
VRRELRESEREKRERREKREEREERVNGDRMVIEWKANGRDDEKHIYSF